MRPDASIDRVHVGAFTVPNERPESDGTFSWDATTVVTVELEAAGCTGLGFTYGPAACASVIGDLLAHVVIGADAMSPPAVWEAMVGAVRNAGRPGIASMAIAAVDVALWDLRARLVDLPLVTVLGLVRPSVPIYGSGGFTSLPDAELCEQLAGWAAEDQIPRVKMKVGTDRGAQASRDMERVRLVREVIGDATELFVDANGAYSRKQAVRIADELAEVDVTWFEEPVSSDDLEGLCEIRSMVSCDVAAGEYGYDLAYFERLASARAVDVMQADVTRCGGITEWLRIAALADAHGLDISGHCAQSLHLHAACAVQRCRHLEYFADHARVDRILFDGVPEPVQGVLRPDLGRSGIGLSLKHSDAAGYRVA